MRNLIKKSLSFLLVAALALTCFVGTLTVSAEDATTPTATIVIKADDVEAGAKQIPVTFTVTSTLGINEALIKVSSNLGDIIAQPTVVADCPADIDNAGNATDYNSFFLSAKSPEGQPETVMGEIKTATISAVFTNEAGLVAGETYTVDVEIPEGKVIAASAGEVAIKLECTKLEITVEEVAACDHANAAKEVTTQPTKDAEGVMTYTCECGETWTEAIAKPTQDDNLAIRDARVVISNTLDIFFRARKTASINLYPNYTFKLVVTPTKYDASYNEDDNVEPVVLDFNIPETNHIDATYLNVGMYELDRKITAYMAVYDENGVFVKYSPSLDTIPSDKLKSMFVEQATLDTYPEASKKIYSACNSLITDILNMGAAAQTYFPTTIPNGTTCDLYNATKMNAGWDANQSWATTSLEGIVNIENATWNPASAVTSSTNNFYCSVDLKGAPALIFNVRRATATGAKPLDYSKLNLKVSYTTLLGGEKPINDEIEGDEWYDWEEGKNLLYTFSMAPMYDSNKAITAVLTYDGVEAINYTYSLDSFVAQYSTHATMGDIITKIGYFNLSARAYFAAQNGVV